MFGKIGRNTSASSGTNPLRADNLGGLIVSGGDYKDMTLGGKNYFAFCASKNVTLFSTTPAVGLIVYNPSTSGVNCVFNHWTCTVHTQSAAMTGLVLAIGTQPTAPTGLTAATLTGQTLLTGSTGLSAGSAVAYSIAAIVAAVIAWPLFHNTADINVVGAESIKGDLNGAFASAPGTCVVMGALGAAGVAVDLGLTWEEVPVGL